MKLSTCLQPLLYRKMKTQTKLTVQVWQLVLFFSSLNPLIEISAGATNSYLNGYSNSPFVDDFKFKENQKHVHHDKIPTLLSSGKQVLETGDEYHPIGEPIIKSGSALQASGEAVYVDDIPSPPNCLHGAYIYSSKPLARVRSIKLSPELQLDGII